MKRFGCMLLALLLIITFAAEEILAEDLPVRKYMVNENGESVIDDVVFSGDPFTPGQNRVFYEIFVGSFSDSDGDGIGDLRGIINRMDYLNDGDSASGVSLGVEGLWLTPVFASPSYHKYDVADYYSIDPSFGTMEDLKELVTLCHERNVLVILDLPINHTSTQNRWFKDFKNAHIMHNAGNEYYDFYTWRNAEEAAPAGHSYTRLQGTGICYESNFSSEMPQLDFTNETVRQELLKVALYYLELGVDGFRFDAAKYIDFGNHSVNVEFWDWYISELKKENPDVYTVAEVWDSEGITDQYASVMNCFNFTASQTSGLIAETAKGGNVNRFTAYIKQRLEMLHTIRSDAMNILFVSNHDMDRCSGYLTAASGQMKMAANLYLLSPGSPFIYYGEEIGLRGSRGSANTDANRRLAMLWGDGDTVTDPVGADYAKQSPYTVKDMKRMEDGLYNYYKRLLMIRKANPEIAGGEYQALVFEDTKLGGFVCTLDGSSVAVIHNTTLNAVTVELTNVTELPLNQLVAVIGCSGAELNGTQLTIDAQTSVILK